MHMKINKNAKKAKEAMTQALSVLLDWNTITSIGVSNKKAIA